MCTEGTMISIAEAASYLNTTEPAVLMMLKRQEVRGTQDDNGVWLIDKASLALCGKPKPSDYRKTGCGGGCGAGRCGGS